MSSPSRPASVAHTTLSTSGAFITRRTTSNWVAVRSSTTSGHCRGSMGSSSRRQRFHSGRMSCGCASPTRCPMAHVTT